MVEHVLVMMAPILVNANQASQAQIVRCFPVMLIPARMVAPAIILGVNSLVIVNNTSQEGLVVKSLSLQFIF